jgi:NRAMP (natural resistance-associated macrophage protein)-like metal ion transporter
VSGIALAGGRLPWILRVLGPGLVAGASDNDPTTVATVAVVGSTTVYSLGWVTLLIFPMLAVVQAIAARVGLSTGRDLASIVWTRYGPGPSWILVASVVCVAVITLGADLKAGAAALSLLTGVASGWFVVPLVVFTFVLLLLGSHERVRKILQVVALIFLAYVISAFLAHPNWSAVLQGTLIPSWHWNSAYTGGAFALLGTTLTSYVYVWETIEVSHERSHHSIREAKIDAVSGAFFVVVIFWFIQVATGATLGLHHHSVQTAEDAARALKPVAGPAASTVFSIGLLASALLALPVVTVVSGHLMAQSLRRTQTSLQVSGLGARSRVDRKSPSFRASALAALAVSVIVASIHISAIHLLFAASIVGGIGTPVSLLFLIGVARDRATMGTHRLSTGLACAAYLVAAMVTMFGLAALVTRP